MFYQETEKKLCLDTLGKGKGEKPGLWECHGEGRHQVILFSLVYTLLGVFLKIRPL